MARLLLFHSPRQGLWCARLGLWCFGALFTLVACSRPADRDLGALQGLRICLQVCVDPRVSAQAATSVADQLGQAVAPYGAVLRVETSTLAQPIEPFPSTFADLQGLPAPAVREALRKPLQRAVDQASQSAGTGLILLLVPELAPADRAAAAVLPELTGLGLPQHPTLDLLERGPDRPVVLLSWQQWHRLDAVAQRTNLLHELGHAAGLAHDSRPGNAMNQGEPASLGWLDQPQLRQLAGALAYCRDTGISLTK